MNELNVPTCVPGPKVGMHTPWGAAHSVSAKCPEKSVIAVSTCSHGGIGVHIPTHPIPEHFKPLAICEDAWAWFEEDECWAAAVLMFPDLFTGDQDSAESTLRNCHPNAYAVHYGRMPTAEESHAVRSREIRERLKDCFTPSTYWCDLAWDVPLGHVYVIGWRSSDGAQAGFLLPADAYKGPLSELVLDGFPRWEPDRSLPYTKPHAVAVKQLTVSAA